MEEQKPGRIRTEGKRLLDDARERTIGYLLGGIGVVVGFAWNDAMKALIDHVFRLEKNSIWAKFAYAGILTIVLVLTTTYLMRLIKKNVAEKETSN